MLLTTDVAARGLTDPTVCAIFSRFMIEASARRNRNANFHVGKFYNSRVADRAGNLRFCFNLLKHLQWYSFCCNSALLNHSATPERMLMAKITPRPHLGKHLTAAIGFAALLGLAAPAHAFDLQVAGSAAPTGTGPYQSGVSGPIYVIDPSTANGGTTTGDQLVLIVGVLNGGAAPTISFTSASCSICSGATSAPTDISSSGPYSLAITANPLAYAYGAVGFSNVNDSKQGDSGYAWASYASAAYNQTASGAFALYTYEINLTTAMTPGSDVDFAVSGATSGSFALAYACVNGYSLGTGGCPSGQGDPTPYADAFSFDAPVPEPASLILFASGLVGMGAFRRRRRRA
jgi:hypothetical protein